MSGIILIRKHDNHLHVDFVVGGGVVVGAGVGALVVTGANEKCGYVKTG